MKFIQLYTTVFLLALAGCDNNSSPYKPTTSPGGNAGEPVCTKTDSFHVDQKCDLLPKINAGKQKEAFEFAFEKGDKIFGTAFTKAQGSGANVGGEALSGYTRMPRADLKGSGQWANHVPKRATGPNAQSCKECHITPAEDGAGRVALNVHRDPKHTGKPEAVIQRNTPHLFGQGALQLLAEEMTADLKDIYSKTASSACASSTKAAEADLVSKGVNFGHLVMSCTSGKAVTDDNKTKVDSVAPDLVVRPFEWKKSVAFVRDFMRGAGHNEIGMQADEIVGKDVDGDGDGVKNELTVGDLTVFAVYMAAQPRPTTKVELDQYGLLDKKLKPEELAQIKRGEDLFGKAGIDCASCHQPKLTLKKAIFSEPSQSEFHRDTKKDLAAGNIALNMEDEGVMPSKAITFDLTQDQPDNVLTINGKEIRLGSLDKEQGEVVVRLYSDLKRHYMGEKLAEGIAEPETGLMGMVPYDPKNCLVNCARYNNKDEKYETEEQATFGTEELWGVACTGPWLHDGRATTLREAIMLHGGEAEASRNAFAKLDESGQKDLIAFLGNQVLYMKKAEDSEIPKLSPDCKVQELL